MRCPTCNKTVCKTDDRDPEGGTVFLARWVKLLNGKITFACPNCKTTLEVPATGKLVLVGTKRAAAAA